MWDFFCRHRGAHHGRFIRPTPPSLFHVLYYINNTSVPGVAGGLRRWRHRSSTLGCSAGGSEAAAAAVISTSHTRWEGSLMTNQLCFLGRGHANASCMIDFSRQPVSTQPWIFTVKYWFLPVYTFWSQLAEHPAEQLHGHSAAWGASTLPPRLTQHKLQNVASTRRKKLSKVVFIAGS